MEYEAVLPVIEHGIDVTRKNGDPIPSSEFDAFTAWCVSQELRRAGWRVERVSD